MIINLSYPPYFTLQHKKSGIKIRTYMAEFLSYDDEKFIKIESKKQSKLNL